MNRLKYWRTERCLTQTDLALATDVPRYVIQLVEQGLRPLDDTQLERISETLGVEPKEIASGGSVKTSTKTQPSSRGAEKC